MTGDESLVFAGIVMLGTFVVFYIFFMGDL